MKVVQKAPAGALDLHYFHAAVSKHLSEKPKYVLFYMVAHNTGTVEGLALECHALP